MGLSSSTALAGLFLAALATGACTTVLGKFSAGGGTGGGSATSTTTTTSSANGGGMSDPCAGKCSPNATCGLKGGDLACQCKPGFSGDGKSCNDIDECAATPAPCTDPNASCKNSPGSFQCVCNPGYAGNGKACAEQWFYEATVQGLFFGKPNSFVAAGPTTIFFANASNKTDRFFAAYYLATKTLSPLKVQPNNHFGGSGLVPALGVIGYNVYSFGSWGQRYIDGVWLQIQNYLEPDIRGSAAGATLGVDLLLIGGTFNSKPLASMSSFDNKALAFNNIDKYPPYIWGPVTGAAAATTPDKKVYVMGGHVGSDLNRAAVYDAANNSWTKLADMPVGAPQPDLAFGDGQLFLSTTKEIWRFDPQSASWAAAGFPFPDKGNNWRLVGAAGKVYALGDFVEGIHIFRLNAF